MISAQAVTVYDATTSKAKVIKEGPIASAIAASAAVPVLMHAVNASGHRLLDGGLAGDVLGVQGIDPNDRTLVLNLFVRAFLPATPTHLPNSVTLDLFGVPFVTPNSLHTTGPTAHHTAYLLTKRALDMPISSSSDNNGHSAARRLQVRFNDHQHGTSSDGDTGAAAAGDDDKGQDGHKADDESTPTTTTTTNGVLVPPTKDHSPRAHWWELLRS